MIQLSVTSEYKHSPVSMFWPYGMQKLINYWFDRFIDYCSVP